LAQTPRERDISPCDEFSGIGRTTDNATLQDSLHAYAGPTPFPEVVTPDTVSGNPMKIAYVAVYNKK